MVISVYQTKHHSFIHTSIHSFVRIHSFDRSFVLERQGSFSFRCGVTVAPAGKPKVIMDEKYLVEHIS